MRDNTANVCHVQPHPQSPPSACPTHLSRSVMRDNNVNVIMISQASSEHSVCFAVKSADTEKALDALKAR